MALWAIQGRVRQIDKGADARTGIEDKFNALTHLPGAVSALARTIVLIVRASLDGDPWKILMTSLASVAMLEKLALLKIAFCNAPVLSKDSWRSSSLKPPHCRYPAQASWDRRLLWT